ncbi:protein kinase family protein [Streptomyces sp. HD]|uniref:protein kinase family protein n=1 Tax=Streptomyces sp. HD TaxID=3020892 RepID=UPI00232F1E04|nr:protein kinase family protein [Streptomyces sp. HD]MDC0766932.1 protein kinase family protein [Streptomyces sp. HD]
MTRTARLSAHTDIATSLALLSDHELAQLVAEGTPAGTGIGGPTKVIEVNGARVFVKQVRLTDTELLAENVRSTANVFDVPAFCHYGIGSPGLGAWRELAVHTMTTNWVVAGRFAGFPLMHHWRILPQPSQPLPDELADVERAVAYWGGGPQVRERIEGLRTASSCLALFLEHIPHTLHDWLGTQLATGDAQAACTLVEQRLEATTAFLRTHQLLHFDTHFHNILTDGGQLYLADYGLALSDRFPLTRQERDFFARHRDYDRAHTTWYLVIWLVTELYGYRGQERTDFVRACADGARPGGGIPEAAAGVIARRARGAVVMDEFRHRLEHESRLAPYPHEALRDALQGVGMPASR